MFTRLYTDAPNIRASWSGHLKDLRDLVRGSGLVVWEERLSFIVNVKIIAVIPCKSRSLELRSRDDKRRRHSTFVVNAGTVVGSPRPNSHSRYCTSSLAIWVMRHPDESTQCLSSLLNDLAEDGCGRPLDVTKLHCVPKPRVGGGSSFANSRA